MQQSNGLVQWVTRLTGQRVPFSNTPAGLDAIFTKHAGIGWSQLNEILLSLGYDRVTKAFFKQFLAPGQCTTIPDLDAFIVGINRFRIDAIQLFGNIKFAFKQLSRMSHQELTDTLEELQPIPDEHYSGRHSPAVPIEPIDAEDTYLLGYLNPNKENLEERITATQAQGIRNYDSYLASDHLDVYIATSMRDPHEYVLVNKIVSLIFGHPDVNNLRLRWFDPTQAYCKERLDKGLIEALMLKRAKCTVYCVQETDTFGKDSELASTLAQGKPVVAVVPDLKEAGIDTFKDWTSALANVYPEMSLRDLQIKFLRVFNNRGAWDDERTRAFLNDTKPMNRSEYLKWIFEHAKELYDTRASTLCDKHPLGLQVSITTGVANGVLVVRNANDCARLIRGIVTRSLEFEIIDEMKAGIEYVILREKISKCVYRIVTGDERLTNSFWNYYLRPHDR